MYGRRNHAITEFCPTTASVIPCCTRCFWILFLYVHSTCPFTANIPNMFWRVTVRSNCTELAFYSINIPNSNTPPHMDHLLCSLRDVPMNSILEFFTYDPNLPLKDIFFLFLSTPLRNIWKEP